MREVGHQLRNRAACRLYLDWDRDGVAVVLDEEQYWELQVAGGVERLPELSFAGRAVARRAVDDLVLLDRSLRDGLETIVAQPRLGAADGLEELCAGGARLADDVERLMAPVRGHLPPARVGVVCCGDCRKEHLGGRHAQRQAEGAVAV